MGSKMKIIKDKNGNLINIGDWNFKLNENQEIQNPFPEDATEHDEEVVTGYDGGLYLANDPKRLGK
jgi:hypothetical protein